MDQTVERKQNGNGVGFCLVIEVKSYLVEVLGYSTVGPMSTFHPMKGYIRLIFLVK